MNTLALATLEALIGLELMALATISKVKAVTLKTWQPIATKYQHLASDTCTENDSQFVFSLPYLPEKVQPEVMFDPEYSFDLDDEQPVQLVLDNGAIVNLGYCECMTNAEFVDLVASHVKPDQQFNLLPYGFDSPITLSDDKDYLMYWFKKFITDDHTILFDDWLKDQPINGYQVAQWLVLLFYGFLQSILLPYCLDLLDRFIQIAHDTRSVIVDNHCDDEIPEYLVKWIPPLTYTEDYL